MFTAFSFALENHWGWDPLSKFSGASARYDNTKYLFDIVFGYSLLRDCMANPNQDSNRNVSINLH